MSARATQGDVFEAIRMLSEAVPEMRAGQLVAALGELLLGPPRPRALGCLG